MSDSFGQFFEGVGRGRKGKSRGRGRMPKTGSRRQRAAARRREAGLHSLHQESLEPRLAMAVTVVDYPRGYDLYNASSPVSDPIPGRVVIASDRADDVFVKQVASFSQDLLVSDNSSFLGYQTVNSIDSYDSLFITNGTARSHVGLLPDGFPNSRSANGGGVSLFMLGPGNIGSSIIPLPSRGSFAYEQSDGTVSTWQFVSATIVSGPGYGGQTVDGVFYAPQSVLPGWVTPTRLAFYDASFGVGSDSHAVEVQWSAPLVADPTFSGGTLAAGVLGAAEVSLQYTLPGAMASLADGADIQRSLGIVPATLRGTLSTAWGDISYFADEAGVLRFGSGSSSTFFDRTAVGALNGPGIVPALSQVADEGVVQVTGRVVGTRLVFTFRNWQFYTRVSYVDGTVIFGDFRGGIKLSGVEGSLRVNASYCTYSQDPTPNEVTMFAGQDFTRELTVDLLTPGSTFNSDTQLAIAGDVLEAVAGKGDYDFRATNVNINAPIATEDRFFAGRSQSSASSRLSVTGPFVSSPTLGLAAPAKQTASAIAEVNKDGTVKQLTVLAGREGYGYDTDNPPVVTVATPESATATAQVLRISGGVVSINVTDKGDKYANGASVTFSRPEAGFIDRIVLNSGGANYASRPTVVLYGGGGTGATAEAVWDSVTKTVTAVTITNQGINYTQPPTIYFYGGETTAAGRETQAARATAFLGYDTATGDAVVVDGRVEDIVVTNPGSGYSASPSVLIRGRTNALPGAQVEGEGATAEAIVAGGIVQVQVTSAGVGYVADSSVTATVRGSGLDQDGAVSFPVDAEGRVRDDQVLSIAVLDGGFGYFDDNPPAVTITGGDGNATAVAVVVNGRVQRIDVTSAGSGYRSAPIIVIGGPQAPGARDAVAVATISQPVVVSPGRFQSLADTTVVMPAPNATATAFRQATASWNGSDLVVANSGAGAGYQLGETVKVYAWGGGATYSSLPKDPDHSGIHGYYGTATVGSNGTITSIATNPAFKGRFTSAPTVFLEPPDQVAAFLSVVDDLGRVNRFVQLQLGQNYVNRPAVTVASPAAVGAALAIATIDAVSGSVTGIEVAQSDSVLQSGYGYLSPPRVVIAPPDEGLGAEQARAIAVIDSEGRVIGIQVIDPGSGYRSRPIVELADVTPRATVESLNVNAAVEANIYEVYVGDDFGTELERGRLFVSPTGGLSAQRTSYAEVTATPPANTLTFKGNQTATIVANASVFGIGIPDGTRITGVKYDPGSNQTNATVTPGALASFSGTNVTLGGGAVSSYIEAHSADLYVESRIEAINQTYLFNSFMPDGQLAPFVFSTRSPNTGYDTGAIIGGTINVTMGNRMPTPLLGSTAFSIVDIATEVASLRMRAGADLADPAGAFPYEVDIREKDDLSIAAVAASSMPIRIQAGGSIEMPAGLSTGSDLTIEARNTADRSRFTTFTVQAPIVSDYGRIAILADTISVRNSLEVKAAAVAADRQDIVLVAERGNMELIGLVSAVNDVSLEQRNRDSGTAGRIFGASKVRGKYVSVKSEGAVELGTQAERLDGRAVTGFVLTEADDITISSLVSGGLVSLTANGVDPGRSVDPLAGSPGNDIALRAYLTEVNQLEVSTPSGSNQVFVDTVKPVALGNPAAIAAGRSMLTAGSSEIRTNGADVTVLDAPVGGTSARLVRTATDKSLAAATGAAVTYNPGVPGTVAATLSGVGSLPAIGGVKLSVGDLVLVKDQVNAQGQQIRENGIYQVTLLGGGVMGSARWELRRAADADTTADMPSNTYVRVGEGGSAGKQFQVSYVSSPTALVERTGTNQLQLPVGYPYLSRLAVGQVVTGTGIAPGARIAQVTPLGDGSTIVRLERLSASVTNIAANVLTLAPSFGGFPNLFVGQRVVGAGVLPGTLITKVDAVGRRVTVSPGGMPYAGLPIAATAFGTLPSVFHGEGFDEWVDLASSFNDFDQIHVGQVVTGPGLNGSVAVTGVDPATRRLGFNAGSIVTGAAAVGPLTFPSVVSVQFGMIQGVGSGYATFDVAPLGMTKIGVSPATVTTEIGSDANDTSVDLVVTSTGVTNSAPSSLGKMLLLRQLNQSQSVTGQPQPMTFAFRTLSGPILLQQELPQISRPFAMVGNSSVVVDGSRIVKTRTGANIGAGSIINGFEFVNGSGAVGNTPGASISNVTIGGFYKGDAIRVTDAKDVLIDSVVMGRGRSSSGATVVNNNAVGVRVSGAGSATILNSQILSAKQYRDTTGNLVAGQGVRTGGGGSVTVVGSTIGLATEGSFVGVELSGSGTSRIGVEPPAVARSQAMAVGGSNQLTRPGDLKAESTFIGQSVIGTGIPTGTVITAINGNTLTLSKSMTFTGPVSLAFGSPGRNAIQYNKDGIRLVGGNSKVLNSDIRFNVFAGILLDGGMHQIGNASRTRFETGVNTANSNAIYANGSWGLNMKSSASAAPKVFDNVFGSDPVQTSVNDNGAGNVAIDGKLAGTPFKPVSTTALDSNGNQHGFRSSKTGGGGTIGGPVTRPDQPRR